MSQFIYKQTFQQIDKDKSGYIDLDQLKELIQSVFQKAGVTLTEQSLQYHLDKFDTSHDKKISLSEFCDKMDKYNHPEEYKKYNKV